MPILPSQVNSLELFKLLVKKGCTWHGDVASKKWTELLWYKEEQLAEIEELLEPYESGIDYKLDRETHQIYLA